MNIQGRISRGHMAIALLSVLVLSTTFYARRSSLRENDSSNRFQVQAVHAIGWKNELDGRLRHAMHLYAKALELNKSYEALVGACSQRDGQEWTTLNIDLSSQLFQPVIDQASDIAMASDFIMDRIESGEINDQTVGLILKTLDQQIASAEKEQARLYRVRDDFIIKVRVLAGSNPKEVKESLDWGKDIEKKITDRMKKILSSL